MADGETQTVGSQDGSPHGGWRRRLRDEPLWLFLLLGLLVFVVDRVAPERDDASDYAVTIDSSQIDRIRAVWRAQTQREPSTEEIDSLLEEHIREEILFREALRLGIDRDDVIVRRRLAQKMSFFIEDASASQKPSQKEARAFFENNLERYRLPERVSFSHVYYSRDRRGEQAAADATTVLASLAADDSSWRSAGDPFMLLREYADRSQGDVVELFGGTFAEALFELPVGGWQGPIESAYGLHLVKILNKTEARVPEFESVEERVIDDLITENRRAANQSYYEELRRRYRVTVDGVEKPPS
jgi:hypothetical protein